MDEEDILKFLAAYLRKKGFKQTEQAFQEELHRNKATHCSSSPVSSTSQCDVGIARQLVSPAESENGSESERYKDEYSKLRSWTYSSLDLYRHELFHVLYLVFIHCFMDLVANGCTQEARAFFNSFREDHETMHVRDLQKLEGVFSPSHLEEMEFAYSLRQTKVNMKICQYSYELLLQFLHKSHITNVLGVINKHINFQVFHGQPSAISDDVEAVAVTGCSLDAVSQINQKEIHWGKLLVEGEKQCLPVKKLKKEKAIEATGKSTCFETNIVTMASRVEAKLPIPSIPVEVEQCILDDSRNCVQLSSVALPSVSLYTFVNTHNGLNCSTISHDGSLVAAGFSNSLLKIWDMAKHGQQAVSTVLEDDIDVTANENGGKRFYTLYQGHSGPVYSASFSPIGDFIISSSADSTIRLWSTKLNTNLVSYKGHNYPVWDVQYSPVGHYFASVSHDRTARIWSVERMQPLRIMAGHLSDVDCVQWHANCNYIATGSSDKTVRLWDVQTGECVRLFIGHKSMVLSLAMSSDGRYMASGDEDGTIMMWDLSSARCVTQLLGHTSCIWTVAFSGEGCVLASGSADCTVKLWDITTSTKVSKTEKEYVIKYDDSFCIVYRIL